MTPAAPPRPNLLHSPSLAEPIPHPGDSRRRGALLLALAPEVEPARPRRHAQPRLVPDRPHADQRNHHVDVASIAPPRPYRPERSAAWTSVSKSNILQVTYAPWRPCGGLADQVRRGAHLDQRGRPPAAPLSRAHARPALQGRVVDAPRAQATRREAEQGLPPPRSRIMKRPSSSGSAVSNWLYIDLTRIGALSFRKAITRELASLGYHPRPCARFWASLDSGNAGEIPEHLVVMADLSRLAEAFAGARRDTWRSCIRQSNTLLVAFLRGRPDVRCADAIASASRA